MKAAPRLFLAVALCLATTAAQPFWQSRPQVAISGGGGGGCTEATNFLARTSGLNGTHTTAYTTMICGMVADGTWALLDVLVVTATQDSTTARLNLKSSSFAATDGPSAPVFTADQGFDGDGSSQYLNTNYNPTTAGGLYTQNSASVGACVRNSRTALNGAMVIGAAQFASGAGPESHIGPRYNRGGGGLWQTVNSDINGSIETNADAQGSYHLSRTGSTTLLVYKNGASLATDGSTSSGRPNLNFFVLGSNVEGTMGNPSDDQVSAYWLGGAFTGAQITSFRNRLTAYMTAVGANAC